MVNVPHKPKKELAPCEECGVRFLELGWYDDLYLLCPMCIEKNEDEKEIKERMRSIDWDDLK